MNDNNTKMICTTAIWIAIAITFTFGVFNYHWTGDFAGILWMLVAGALTVAATEATRAIWKSPSSDKDSDLPPNEKPKA